MTTQNLMLIVGLFVATLLGTAGGYYIIVKLEEHRAWQRESQIPANEVFKTIQLPNSR